MNKGMKYIYCALLLCGLAIQGFSQTLGGATAGGASSGGGATVGGAGGGTSGGEAQATVLTLDSAIAQAVANRTSIGQAGDEVLAAQAAVGVAQSGYYPKVNATGNYMRVEPNQSFTFPGLGTFSLSQEDNWDFHVGLSQIVYDFGKRDLQVKLAESEVGSGRISLDQVKEDLAFKAAQTFYSALFLQEELASLDGQLADLNGHLSVIQKKEETGSATKYDVLSTQVQVATLQGQRIQAASQYRKAQIALAQLVGLDPSSEVVVNGSLASNQDSGDVSAFIAQALADRPDLRQASVAEDAAQLNLDLAKTGGLPTLVAQAEAGYKNGLLPDESSLTFNWAAGLTVNVPLFNGLLAARQIDEARAGLDAAKEKGAALKSGAITQVLQALQDLSASHQAEETSRAQLDQAQQALDAAKIQYELGVITNDEYLSSQTALAQAKLANLLARYNEVASDYSLKEALAQRIWQ